MTAEGIHTCQGGRADGATWFTIDEMWNCPFCGQHGPRYLADPIGDIENWKPTGFLNQPTAPEGQSP